MQIVSVDELIGKTIGSAHPLRLLGHGKLSAVYEAYQPEQNRSVMLTLFLVPASFPADAHERFLLRFHQEATALARLNHPAILPVYDFGAYLGYPYLVTPFVNKVPLARFLKQHGPFSPKEALLLLQQIGACLDYAHAQNVIHGTLSASNILIDQDSSIQVAGFGFMRMLEARGIVLSQEPYAHLLSIADTFLGSPEYLAPEYVQGQPADSRIDVYALGILLYELLSGIRPFEGSNPYEVALQHVQNRVPSLHEQFAFVPAALDVVVDQALEKNPAQRFQSAGALTTVLERVLKILDATSRSAPKRDAAPVPDVATIPQSPSVDPKLTMPPTVNWFDEEVIQARARQATKTGALSAVNGSAASPNQSAAFYQSATTQIPEYPDDQAPAIDPFAWWSAASQPDGEPGQLSGGEQLTEAKRFKPVRQVGARSGKRRQAISQAGRRRTVAVLAAGGVVALGALGFGGVSLAHLLTKKADPVLGGHVQTTSVSTPTQAKAPTTAATPTTPATPTHAAPTATPAPQPKATTAAMSQPTPTTGPNQQPTASPTAQPPTATPAPPPPTATPAPPAHTGTVIGSTGQGTNSGQNFTNPADGQASLLIHTAGGNFTAFEKSCTHEGAPTYYDSGAQVIRCTRHTDGIFDPNSGSPKGGPPPRPLPQVQIRVNGDGTITTG